MRSADRRERMSYKDFRGSRLKLSHSLDGQRWIFLKKGLDDFRDGLPPSSDNIIVYGRKRPVSITLQSSTLRSSPTAPREESKKRGTVQVCLSKLSPLQQARRERVAHIEHCLNQHPVVLCPRLGRSISSKGGENFNIGEDTLKSLLNTSCDVEATVPSLCHAAKYNEVEGQQPKSQETSLSQTAVRSSHHHWSLPCKVPSQTKRIKIRYGARYLDPKTWRKQKANEPLRAPEAEINSFGKAQKWSEKVLSSAVAHDAIRRSLKSRQEMKVAQLHSTKAFKEFLERKGYRNPQFLPKMPAGGNDSRGPEETSKACKRVPKEIGQKKRHPFMTVN